MDNRTDVQGAVQAVFGLSDAQKRAIRAVLPLVRERGKVGMAKLLDGNERFALFVGPLEKIDNVLATIKGRGFPCGTRKELTVQPLKAKLIANGLQALDCRERVIIFGDAEEWIG